MSNSAPDCVLFSESEARAAAAYIEARFADSTLEAERVTVAREFLDTAFAVERAVQAHYHCALVNHRGTRGSNSLAAATDELFHALSDYAAAIRATAARCNGITTPRETNGGDPTDTREGPRLAVAP